MPEAHLGTVLVVDDEDNLRFVVAAHLRAAGFDVLEAREGAEGLRVAQERTPDVIVLDVTMPVMDGITAAKSLRAKPETTGIPIIMLTARSRTEDLVQGLEAGAQEYVVKPFEVAELVARVRTVHRLAMARRELDQLNTKLEREVDQKTRRLRLLYEYVRDLSCLESRDQILDLVVDCVRKVTDAKRISLLMMDSAGKNLVCERAVGIDPTVVQSIQVKPTHGIAGQVYRSRKTMVAQALNRTGDGSSRYEGEAFLSTPILSASLATSEGVVGVLNVTEKSSGASFTEDELDCILSIADAAAIALYNVMRRQRLERSVGVLLETVGLLAEYRDEETTEHLGRVSRMVRVLARQLAQSGPYAKQITDEYIELLVQAAPMHDIGKVGIPDEILTKPGKLTEEEFQIMKTHTDIGRRVLSQALDPDHSVPLLDMCIEIAWCHHERFNGNGYPRRLAGDHIPLAARIVALVDAYDAITSERRYSKARSHEEAVRIIREEAGHHFDPAIVEAFLACHSEFDVIRTQDRDLAVREPVAVTA